MKICPDCNVYRPLHEITAAGTCSYCETKRSTFRRAEIECRHYATRCDADGTIRCRNCQVILLPPRPVSAYNRATTSTYAIDSVQAALGLIGQQIRQTQESVQRESVWNELTGLVLRQGELRHKRRIERLERLGSLTEEARVYKLKSAREAFDQILPPEPLLESIRTHGKPQLLGAPIEDDSFVLSDEDIQEILDSYDASVERIERGFARAKLTKRERDIFRLRSRGYSQEQVASKLKISQPAVAKALAKLRGKFESVGIERPACQLCGRITYRLNKVGNQYQCGPCANGEPSWDQDVEDQGWLGDRRQNGESMRLRDWE
jgi:DNA-binding CsgD family transcriptional regulator